MTTRLLRSFAIVLFSTTTLISSYAQKVEESFSGFKLTDWYVKNNTSPQPSDEVYWHWGPTEPIIGVEDGSTNPFTFRHHYAYVGYTPSDYDDAQMSQWFISPVLRNLKNGDTVQFKTRAQPSEETIHGALQNINSVLSGDLSPIISGCNRPNRMEVRLNTKISNYPNDSIIIGNKPNDYGDFDIVLKVINDGLIKSGYPRSNWQTYTIIVSGLPQNQAFDSRIGFWYHFDHAGYDNCEAQRNHLSDDESQLINVSVSQAANIVGQVSDGGGMAINALSSIAFRIEAAAESQDGYNGTYIGLDEFKYLPARVFLKDEDAPNAFVGAVNNKPSVATGTEYGYRGSYLCRDQTLKQKIGNTYYLYNHSDSPVTVTDDFSGFGASDFYVVYDGSTTIAPGKRLSLSIFIKDSLQQNSITSAKVNFRDANNSNALITSFNIRGIVLPQEAPTARCKESIDLILDSDGNGYIADPFLIDDGSTDACGSWQVTRNLYRNINQSDTLWYNCSDVGNPDVYASMIVIDNLGRRSNDFCNTQVNVIDSEAPVFLSGLGPQTYYLSSAQNGMPIEDMDLPTISDGCETTLTYDLGHESFPAPSKLGVGEHIIRFIATDASGNQSTGLKPVNVLDTIKPNAICHPEVDAKFFTVEYEGETIVGSTGYIYGKDLSNGSYDNVKIKEILMSTPNYNSGAWTGTFVFDCNNIGEVWSVDLKVIDYSGNESICGPVTVNLPNPAAPKCKQGSFRLDAASGQLFINGKDLLQNADGNCGVHNVSLSKFYFDCDDADKFHVIDVSYLDGGGVERTCKSVVSINDVSEKLDCEDTVVYNITDLYVNHIFSTPGRKICDLGDTPWGIVATGRENFVHENLTDVLPKALKPGITEVKRFNSVHESHLCNQVFDVRDTVPPALETTPQDVLIQLGSVSNCTKEFEINNPFDPYTCVSWTYSYSGATTSEYPVTLNRFQTSVDVELNMGGITTITLEAVDYANNKRVVTYDVDIQVQNLPQPLVVSDELSNEHIRKGEYCGENEDIYISSPMIVGCGQTDYMWYYEVRDELNGNILYEEDSIPQSSGTNLPIKVSPFLSNHQSRTVQLGYHNKTYGHKVSTGSHWVFALDSVTQVECPNDTVVENSNNVTYTYDYLLNSPISGLCNGGYWGYQVTGATEYSTVLGGGETYTSNQQHIIDYYNTNDPYPTLAYDYNEIISLNAGNNNIRIRYLETSGNLSECTYHVEVIDVTTPNISCPANDTIHRSSTASCEVAIEGTCTQINGFNSPYGVSGIKKMGGNRHISLDKSDFPNSLQFNNSVYFPALNDAYIKIPINCSGTVSFDWEYNCTDPANFRPFVVLNNYNVGSQSQTAPTGFDIENTGLQTGTFSQSVNPGDVLYIGLTEGGTRDAYFKLSSFSAPYYDPNPQIMQPTFTEYPFLSYESDIQPSYAIGDHELTYSLTNEINGNVATCTQQLTIIDDFATTLVCHDDTVYLNQYGVALVSPDDFVSTCFPISSTTMSQDTFTCEDIGTNLITINTIDQSSNPHSCNFNLTVIDNTPPKLIRTSFSLDLLPPGNLASLSDSTIRASFIDYCGIETSSASKTSFTCSDVGTNIITLTATDSSGNITTKEVLVEVHPLGFEIDDPALTFEVCQGEDLRLFTNSVSPQNSLTWVWQSRGLINGQVPWNFYTCNHDLELLPGSDGHKFFRLKSNDYRESTYMAYVNAGTADIHFRRLNKNSQTWEPALKPIPRAVTNFADGNNAFFMDAFDVDKTPYVVYLDETGALRLQRYVGGEWGLVDSTIFGSINNDHDDLYFNDGYFFPVKFDGDINVGKEASTNTSQWWYMYQGSSFNTYVANAGNIVGVRNDNNQNMFFSLNINTNNHITGKDSLLTDPTSNSSLFAMELFNGESYIAYQSPSGKASVKKYAGADTWVDVGTPDFSAGNIVKLDIETIENELYVLYEESGSRLVVHKFDGTDWVELRSPSDDNTFSSINSIKLYDIAGVPSIYINYQGAAEYKRLIRNDGWKDVAIGSSYYDPNTDSASVMEYRSLTTKFECATTASGVKTVIVKEIPTIEVEDKTIDVEGTTTLEATKSIGTVNWLSDLEGGALLSNDSIYTTHYLSSNEVFYAYAANDQCYSDTVAAHVFVNDIDFYDYTITHPDTICPGEDHVVALDTFHYGFQYELYEKGTDGRYVYFDGPYSGRNFYYGMFVDEFYIYPSTTSEYKFKVQESVLDAAAFTNSESPISNEHIDFGTLDFPEGNTVTIEAWVYTANATSPNNVLGQVYSNASSTSDPASMRNWEWDDGKFMVHNGNTTREVLFPNLPSTFSWTHVATTAGPDSLVVYYNGVKVASNVTSAPGSINNNSASLTLRKRTAEIAMTGAKGLDEFRVWAKEKTASEISNEMNSCLHGSESGLWLYNDFDEYDPNSNIFTSIKGNNAILRNQPIDTDPQRVRDSTCTDIHLSEIFLDPFTVVVKDGATITDWYNFDYDWGPTINDTCGGQEIELVAEASSGGITWYNAPTGGDIVGVGDTLRIFMDQDTAFYAQASSACKRERSEVNVVGYPEVEQIDLQQICFEDAWEDAIDNDQLSDNTEGYKAFSLPTGGVEVDLGDDAIADTTFWLEAYNDYCVQGTRYPISIDIVNPQLISYQDTATCGPGGPVSLFAEAQDGFVEWWSISGIVDTGSTVNIPQLDTTVTLYATVNGYEVCYAPIGAPVTATVHEIGTKTDTIIACDAYTWVDGITYTQSDTGIVYIKPNSPCDSILKLDVTIVKIEDRVVLVGGTQLCTGDSTTITIGGAQNGFNYTIRDTSDNSIVAGPIVGNGSNIVFNTGALTSAIGYRIDVDKTTTKGSVSHTCSEQLGNIITINVGTAGSYRTAFACGNYIWNGNTYTSSGVYDTTIVGGSASGCDSIATLDLTLSQPTASTFAITSCDSYTWYDSTYTLSTDTVTWTIIGSNGCDSVITLDLTINNSMNSDTNATACDQFTWHGKTYGISGQFNDTLQTVGGCDSIVTLNLTISHGSNRDTIASTCGPFTWYGNTYTASGQYVQTFQNSAGCDSTITLDLTVGQDVTGHDTTVIACEQYVWHNNTYTSSGDYTRTLTNESGCDSVVSLHLTIGQTVTTDTSVNACESYYWIDTDYTVSGDYTRVFNTSLGCDSTVTLHLAIYGSNNPTSGSTQVTSCGSYTSPSGNYIWTTTGIYYDTLVNGNQFGCDSVITVDLTINSTPIANITGTDTIISGSTDTLVASGGINYEWSNGSTNDTLIVSPTTDTTFSVIVTSSNGCTDTDSFSVIVNTVSDLGGGDNIVSFTLHPNPVNNILYLDLVGEKHTTIQIEVLDEYGRVLYSTSQILGSDPNLKYNASQLVQGMYFVKVIADGQIQVRKFIKE